MPLLQERGHLRTPSDTPIDLSRSWEAVPLRTKRAETKLVDPTQPLIFDAGPSNSGPSTANSSLHKSSIADPIKSKKKKSIVNFGYVEEREISDADSDESLISIPD